MTNHYADVAPFIPLSATKSQVFTYHLPLQENSGKLIGLYQVVKIPWRGRQIKGVILKLHSVKTPFKTKALIPLKLPPLTPEQVKFAHWIADTMRGGLGYTLRLFSPPAGGGVARRLPGGRGGSQSLILTAEKWRADQIFNQLPTTQQASAAVFHTGQTAKNLNSIWRDVLSGQVKTIIGTQKSLFLPFTKLQQITLDQEDLPTHKLWDQYPHLHNFYAANALAAIHSCPVKYTSLLPSLRLENKVTRPKQKLPTQIISPTWPDRKSKYPLPTELVEKIRAWQSKRQTILLFANQDTKPIKHFLMKVLPKGTQVNRVASDKSSRDAGGEVFLATSAIFAALPEKKYHQIAFLYPERSLTYPDYRSEERAYHLLYRLASLFTQPTNPVHVITKNPRLITDKLLLSPADFYQKQIKARQKLNYPPAADLVLLSISEKQKNVALKNALVIRDQIKPRLSAGIYLRGPFFSFKETQKDQHTCHLLLSGPLEKITPLYKNLPVDRVDLDPHKIL